MGVYGVVGSRSGWVGWYEMVDVQGVMGSRGRQVEG